MIIQLNINKYLPFSTLGWFCGCVLKPGNWLWLAIFEIPAALGLLACVSQKPENIMHISKHKLYCYS